MEETELEIMSGARIRWAVLGAIAGLAAITATGNSDAADTQQSADALGGLLGALGNSQRTRQGSANQAMGIKTSSAEVDFQGAHGARVNVSIKDATIGGRNVHEKWSASDKHGELSLILAQRFGVDITGYGVGMDALEAALARIDLGKLESMKDANPRAQ